MSVTVIKEGNTLRLLSASEEIPDGQVLHLVQAGGGANSGASVLHDAELNLQMPSFVRGDEAEAAEELF